MRELGGLSRSGYRAGTERAKQTLVPAQKPTACRACVLVSQAEFPLRTEIVDAETDAPPIRPIKRGGGSAWSDHMDEHCGLDLTSEGQPA